MKRKKPVNFYIDAEDSVDRRIRLLFNRIGNSRGIPKGELLSRALYLACLELEGKENLNYLIANPPSGINRYSNTEYDTSFLKAQEWRDYCDKAHDEYIAKVKLGLNT